MSTLDNCYFTQNNNEIHFLIIILINEEDKREVKKKELKTSVSEQASTDAKAAIIYKFFHKKMFPKLNYKLKDDVHSIEILRRGAMREEPLAQRAHDVEL